MDNGQNGQEGQTGLSAAEIEMFSMLFEKQLTESIIKFEKKTKKWPVPVDRSNIAILLGTRPTTGAEDESMEDAAAGSKLRIMYSHDRGRTRNEITVMEMLHLTGRINPYEGALPFIRAAIDGLGTANGIAPFSAAVLAIFGEKAEGERAVLRLFLYDIEPFADEKKRAKKVADIEDVKELFGEPT